jgi:hypothetical protein
MHLIGQVILSVDEIYTTRKVKYTGLEMCGGSINCYHIALFHGQITDVKLPKNRRDCTRNVNLMPQSKMIVTSVDNAAANCKYLIDCLCSGT